VDDADHVIHEAREAAGAGETVALLDQPAVGVCPAAIKDLAQVGHEPRAQARMIASRGPVEARSRSSNFGVACHARPCRRFRKERKLHATSVHQKV
jgi:hypothetical protein